MNFNKIKMITKDRNEFIEALKEEGNKNLGEDSNKSYELNEDYDYSAENEKGTNNDAKQDDLLIN